jgi:hypothetical protein
MSNMRRPNVFLAGAPKCGTTSLANWLAGHPQCFVSPRKEPHYFSDFLKVNMSIDAYEKLFVSATQDQLVQIDASTSYFTSPVAISKILHYQPGARFIIMLRNPIDLVYSLHSEFLYLGIENVDDFALAWRLQGDRRKGRSVPSSCNNSEMLLYRDQALLGKAMEALLSAVGRERVHWIFMEELGTNPRQVYLNVLDHLGLEDDGRKDFPVMNQSKKHRFPIANRVLRTIGLWRSRMGLPGLGVRTWLNHNAKVVAPRAPLSSDMRAHLYKSFQHDIELLQSLVSRDLSQWRPE